MISNLNPQGDRIHASGFGENGHPEPIVEFNYDALDGDDFRLEPLNWEGTELRRAAIQLLGLLTSIDTFMSSGSPPPPKWQVVSLALGLASSRGETESSVALALGVTRAAVSKEVTTFQRMCRLPGVAFGLKTETARRKYQATNGHRDHTASVQSDA